jgi:hypothetical protein
LNSHELLPTGYDQQQFRTNGGPVQHTGDSNRSGRDNKPLAKGGQDGDFLTPLMVRDNTLPGKDEFWQIGERVVGAPRSSAIAKMQHPLLPAESVSSSQMLGLLPGTFDAQSARRSSQGASPTSVNKVRDFIISGSSTNKKQLHFLRL